MNGQEGVWSRAISHNRVKSVYKSLDAHGSGNEMIHEMCECAYKCPLSVYVYAQTACVIDCSQQHKVV